MLLTFWVLLENGLLLVREQEEEGLREQREGRSVRIRVRTLTAVTLKLR